MARTLQQQLDDLDKAIERAEAAQAYTLEDGRGKQNPLLATLYRERERLERKLSNSGSMATLCRFQR